MGGGSGHLVGQRSSWQLAASISGSWEISFLSMDVVRLSSEAEEPALHGVLYIDRGNLKAREAPSDAISVDSNIKPAWNTGENQRRYIITLRSGGRLR